MDQITAYPRLIESGAKNYMSSVLNKCHENRISIYLWSLNAGVLFFFIGIVLLVLYYCYKNKVSPEENYQKMLEEQEYVLQKIRFYKEHQRNINSRASITGLPTTDLRPI